MIVDVPPFSAIGEPDSLKLTLGAASSSAIVIVCCALPSVPLVTELIATRTVSSDSSRASSTPVIVTLPVVLPAVIII